MLFPQFGVLCYSDDVMVNAITSYYYIFHVDWLLIPSLHLMLEDSALIYMDLSCAHGWLFA